jgi:hypothetical protein
MILALVELDKRSAILVRDKQGKTPRDLATINAHRSCVDILLEKEVLFHSTSFHLIPFHAQCINAQIGTP